MACPPEGRLASLNLFPTFSALANSLSKAFWHLWASFLAALEPLPTLAVLSALLTEAQLDELWLQLGEDPGKSLTIPF